MTKNGIALVIIIILIILGVTYFNKKDDSMMTTDTNTDESTEQMMSDGSDNMMSSTTETMHTSTSTTTDNMMSDKTSHIITYTDTGFSPATTTIKSGDTIVFKNDSARAFWPASNDHPTHTIYPEFDAKKIIPAGESWSFIFTKTGTWKYHDHVSSKLGGTIVVQ